MIVSTPSFIHIKTQSKFKSCRFYRIGIVGLGAFGQFLANAFQRQGHNILGTSRSDYSEYCQKHGIEFFRDLNDLCDAQPDVLLVCSSILSTETIVRGLPFHKLRFNTIIADVLSVKQFPKNLFLELVPSGFGILCTHPMFGKYSGKNSWEGLRFVYDKVRISKNSEQERNCERFLNIFQDQGCKMVEMTCEDHDQYAAESQFVTHTVARILANMKIESTPVDTKGYEILVELTRNTVSHGSDLYDGLFLYNVNSTKQIKKLEKAFDAVKQNLFNKLRDSYRRQIEESGDIEEKAIPTSQMLPSPEKVLNDISSFSTMVSEARRTRK
ncbi:prephenate dehydrogenase (NADP(+)) [Ranunculus cassubicifolius]